MPKKPYHYSWELMTGYQYDLKQAFCFAVDFNDIKQLDAAYLEAKKLIEGEKRGRPSGNVSNETRRIIDAHTCSVLAMRDGTSYTRAWMTYYGSGQVKKPQCTPQESARHLIGYCAIDVTTRRMVHAFRLDLLEYAKDAQSPH